MRRAISIETDLLTIQAEILRDRRNDSRVVSDTLCPRKGSYDNERADPDVDRGDQIAVGGGRPLDLPRALTYCFLRLGNLDGGAFERLGRYNAVLWRQTAQMLFLLQSTRQASG